MHAAPKAKILAALRSGEYEQTRGALAIVDGPNAGFCCLGVMCEEAIKDGVEVKTRVP